GKHTEKYNLKHFSSTKIAETLSKLMKPDDRAIVICGRGDSVIALNRHSNLLAGVGIKWEQISDMRHFDNINVLVLSSWHGGNPVLMARAFLKNDFIENENSLKEYKTLIDENYGKLKQKKHNKNKTK
ncbi:RpiB/LacA/LacB family sugar-phosphate isomerase, partial [Lachnospiraceae bacterium OttesenSCG-928-E19]|nr:RpiB/LacA/LacB family sugar-phosphate isomerase [Lachnospiraceae bacterium OttesenSCG-928-E19]